MLLAAIPAAASLTYSPSSYSTTLLTNKVAHNTNTKLWIPEYEAPSALYNLNTAANRIEFANASTLGSLLTKWRANQNETPIVIAHFGDSHVQPGWQVAPIRKALQTARGNGGRGMIFPYTIAKRTYSQEDYTITSTGSWRTANSIQQPPKIGVGVTGFVAVTSDSFVKVNFKFKQSADTLGNINAALNFRAMNGRYEVTASNGVASQTKVIDANIDNQIQSVNFELPDTDKEFSFTISRLSGGPNAEFEFHGVNLDNANINGGVTYHNLGVGGANFKAIEQQKHFEQFASLNADLVILDWGTNDILYTNSIPNYLERTIRNTIQKVRAINPNAAILLSSVQETRYKGQRTTAAAQYSELLRRIAIEENVMFYDWYQVSGGPGSMRIFQDTGYANPKDSIHLNGKGYRVKGELFAQALVDALNNN
ncbi:hypothetical protein B0181_00220 [Moraxella caviae]|nr:hypothetical protein B0181_00220 [Moraxella caviae]